MPKIGYFTEDRLKNISRRHWAEHDFSFYLGDLIAASTQEAEPAGAGRLRVKLEKDLCITPFHHERPGRVHMCGGEITAKFEQ